MKVIAESTVQQAVSRTVNIPPDGYVMFSLHGLPLGTITSGHKIQVLINGEWEDFLAWAPDTPTKIVLGASDEILTVRVFKEATSIPVGVRVSPVGYIAFEIESLFSEFQDGAVIDPYQIETLNQLSDGSTPVTDDNQRVGRAESTINSRVATQTTSTARPFFRNTSGPPRLTFNKVANGHRLMLPMPVGNWQGTMILATPQGTAVYGFIVTGTLTVGGQSTGQFFPSPAGIDGGLVYLLVRIGAMSQQEIDDTINWLVEHRGASTLNYSGVTNVTSYWAAHNFITSFPELDFSSVTTVDRAWFLCSNLVEFPLLDFSNVLNATYAWRGCTSLVSIPLLNFSNVTNISYTWSGCNSLTSFPELDLSSVTDVERAWENCTSLTEFPLVNLSNCNNFNRVWYNCNSLTEFPMIDLSNATNIDYTWNFCHSLTEFPLLNLSSVTSANGAWMSCTSFTSFPLVDLSNVTAGYGMWGYCSSLTEFPLLNLSSVTDISWAWASCTSLTSLPLLNISNATDVSNTWQDCTSLTSFPELNLSSAINAWFTWENCTSLTSFPNVNLSSVDSIWEAWKGCTALTSFSVANLSSVTEAYGAWWNCSSLADFPAGVFDGGTCTDFTNAFTNTNLTTQSIDNILVSINSNNTSNGTFNQSGGQGVSVTGQTAINEMRTRGWTVTVTEEYVYNITELFSASQDGIIFDPYVLDNMNQLSDGTTPVTDDDQPVGWKQSVVNGRIATQSNNSLRPIFRNISGPPRLTLNKLSQRLNLTVPTGGWQGTMVLATLQGTATYGVNIPQGTFHVGAQSIGRYAPTEAGLPGGIVGMIIRNGVMSQQEIDDAVGWLTSNRDANPLPYTGVTNIDEYWYIHPWITEFPLLDLSSVTSAETTWFGCSGLTSFPTIDLTNVINVTWAWGSCSSLTSFPLIDLSNVTNITHTWRNCSSLTSFPLINFNSAVNASGAWRNCSSLTSFPNLNLNSVTNIIETWMNCASLITFSVANLSSITHASSAWRNCSSLTTFPAGVFDGSTCNGFFNAFTNTNLTTQSIDNILVSINSNNTSNGTFTQSGGQAPSATGQFAIDAMRSRGWTVTVTQEYTFTLTTLDPLNTDSSITLSGANLIATGNANSGGSGRSTISKNTGKWYCEVTLNAFETAVGTESVSTIGIIAPTALLTDWLGNQTGSIGYWRNTSANPGQVFFEGVASIVPVHANVTDVVGIAWNADTGEVWFSVNNVWIEGDPVAGTGATQQAVSLQGEHYIGVSPRNTGNQVTLHDTPTYTPPFGFNYFKE